MQDAVIVLIVAAGIGALLWYSGALTRGGVFATLLLGLALWKAGGFSWLLVAFSFLSTSSLWTRWPGGEGSLGKRSAVQVVANGLPAFIGAVLVLLDVHLVGRIVMVSSFAAAAADTWATSWGHGFGGTPIDLRKFRKTEKGVSGAISVAGTVAALLGALFIALVAWRLNVLAHIQIVPVVIAGFIGSMADSFAGAWLQAIWIDKDGAQRELKRATDSSGNLVRGFAWIDNNMVNLICTSVGAIVGIILVTGWR